jgi:hypothetical protein
MAKPSRKSTPTREQWQWQEPGARLELGHRRVEESAGREREREQHKRAAGEISAGRDELLGREAAGASMVIGARAGTWHRDWAPALQTAPAGRVRQEGRQRGSDWGEQARRVAWEGAGPSSAETREVSLQGGAAGALLCCGKERSRG